MKLHQTKSKGRSSGKYFQGLELVWGEQLTTSVQRTSDSRRHYKLAVAELMKQLPDHARADCKGIAGISNWTLMLIGSQQSNMKNGIRLGL